MSSNDSTAVTAPGNANYGAGALFQDYGVTEDGFERPHIDTILEAAVAETEQQLGRRLTSPSAAERQYVEMIVLWTTTYFETLEALYYAGYYEHASGQQLDEVLALPTFPRLPRQEATGEVTFVAAGARQTGTDDRGLPVYDPDSGNDEDVRIPGNTRVTTPTASDGATRIIFRTTRAVVLPASQPTITRVSVRALSPPSPGIDLSPNQLGSYTNIEVGHIRRILDPVPGGGVTGVFNPLPTGGSGEREDGTAYSFRTGRDRELDDEYRRRYENSYAQGGTATLEAIHSGIINAGDGYVVKDVRVQENFREIDKRPDGGPPHSVSPLVWFEADEPTQADFDAVHQAILDKRGGGIESYGDIDGTALLNEGTPDAEVYPAPGATIVDDTGDTRSGLGFSLVAEIPIYVSATLYVTDEFGDDGVEQIKQNVADYIRGESVSGTTIGRNIYDSQVVGRIMDPDIIGVEDIQGDVGIDTTANPTVQQDIQIPDDSVATVTLVDIQINTTPA